MSQVYDSFVSHLFETRGRISASEHLRKIRDLSTTARRIFLAEEGDADRALVAAARIRAMDSSTALPVLMALPAHPGKDRGDVTTSAAFLESFLVSRMVCGLNTGMYGLFFVDVMNAVARADWASDAIVAMLMRKRSDSTRWPDDAEFGQAWRSNPLYRTLRRGRLGMVLRALEASLRDPALTDPVAIPMRLHVEHVMPQSWEQWWPLPADADREAAGRRDRIVHTVGNLTSLKEKLNEWLSNAPWSTGGSDSKRSALQQHGLMRLNTMLAGNERWDEATILARSDELLAHAVRIWPRPQA